MSRKKKNFTNSPCASGSGKDCLRGGGERRGKVNREREKRGGRREGKGKWEGRKEEGKKGSSTSVSSAWWNVSHCKMHKFNSNKV